jgi:hypothetical protein
MSEQRKAAILPLMQSDPIEEWRRITEVYREKSDEELLELADDFADLTDAAKQVLRDEMRRRGLPLHEERQPAIASHESSDQSTASQFDQDGLESDLAGIEREDDPRREYTWKTPLCECNDRVEAWQIYEVLRRAGIESWIEGSRRYPRYADFDHTNPRVVVAADQIEQARAVVAKPIPQEIIDESRMDRADYEPPSCPKCGAGDPILEGVNPANSWRCEACGMRWAEPIEAPPGADGHGQEFSPR